MLMPSASVSVAKTTLTRPSAEQLLDDLLEHRQHAGVVRRDAAVQRVRELAVAEHAQVVVRDARRAVLDDARGSVAFAVAP